MSQRIWEFDRYVRGQLKAEGIRITRAETFEQAMLKAVELAQPHDVLVLRSSDEPSEDPRTICYSPCEKHRWMSWTTWVSTSSAAPIRQVCPICEPPPPPAQKSTGQQIADRVAHLVTTCDHDVPLETDCPKCNAVRTSGDPC